MQIKFIGTGSGKTSLKRFHSALILSGNNYNLLVDAGDGISKALLQQNISYLFINGILITHLHPDHYSGLAALIVQMKITGRTEALDIFVHENLIESIKSFIFNSYIFQAKTDFKIRYFPFKHDEKFEINESIKFTSKQNSHLNDYLKYDTNKELSFKCSSLLFECYNKKIFYTGDIGIREDLYLFREVKPDVMITEITHVPFEDILTAIQELKPAECYLTHISDDDEQFLSDLNNIVNASLIGKLFAAYDGLAIEI